MPESGDPNDKDRDDCDCDCETTLTSVGELFVLGGVVFVLGDAIRFGDDGLDCIVFELVVVL